MMNMHCMSLISWDDRLWQNHIKNVFCTNQSIKSNDKYNSLRSNFKKQNLAISRSFGQIWLTQ